MEKSPPDIVLAFAALLDVEDLLNLLATCRRIRALSAEPALWIGCLQRIECVQMHPVTSRARDFAALPLAELKAMAHRAARILRNLASPSPRLERILRIAGALKDGHFLIPGTGLLLTNPPGRVDCWDVVQARVVASVAHERLRIFGMSCVWSGSRVLFSAAIIESERTNDVVLEAIAVVCVDLKDREKIRITTVVSPRIIHATRQTPHFPDVFITEKLMGIVCHRGTFTMEAVGLLCWPIDASQPVSICRYPFPEDQRSILSFDAASGILYGLVPAPELNTAVSVVHSFPLRALSNGGIQVDPSAPVASKTLVHPDDNVHNPPGDGGWNSWSSAGFAATCSADAQARFGVRAVAWRSQHFQRQYAAVGAAQRRLLTSLTFLRAGPGTGEAHAADALVFAAPAGDGNHVGGYSGRYLVFSSGGPGLAGQGSLGLGIARLPERPGGALRIARFSGGPDGIDLNARDIRVRAVDDILGLVVLWDRKQECANIYSYSGDWGRGCLRGTPHDKCVVC
ncbi:hypothetical protein MIND_01283100 [Mycena indigotica]|uniref:F-box domain-containing protein n=1 Tax=Mycena indigotica TaxID=2126181 RepID=A0A8H6S4X7_9AGAR|nr:uncharacterized protein MIND_01283100 [Mycena indigotica]KAF7291385.1 hypothetical protein MIND_01283100 [Mycena indigotica]